MSYSVKVSIQVEEHIACHIKEGNKKLASKIARFIAELQQNPRMGTGKPEQLKGCEIETWSRRIDHRHRLLYEIRESELIVIAISAYGHYEDK